MALNKVLLAFIVIDVVFLTCGAILIALPLVIQKASLVNPDINTIAQILLLRDCPLTAILVNGVFMLLAFAFSLPGIFLTRNRFLLSLHAWIVWFCATFTLCVGLSVWFLTLKTTRNLRPIFETESDLVISMLQSKFVCCGYKDATKFVVDAVCPNAADAARKGLCAPPFSAFANKFLSEGFTTMFGICAVDGLLIVAALCVLKDRAEQTRYRLMDARKGYRG